MLVCFFFSGANRYCSACALWSAAWTPLGSTWISGKYMYTDDLVNMHDVNTGESERSSTRDFHTSNARIVSWVLEHPASPSDEKTLHFCLQRVQCSLHFWSFLGHIFFIHLLLQTNFILNNWSLSCVNRG